MTNFLFSLIASIIASILVLFIDKQRLPQLEIFADSTANTTNEYPNGRGKWKFVRVRVRNKKMPLILKWLIRQTAENCKATLSFFNEAQESLFNMRGRWASTPELVILAPNEQIVKTLFPDPVTILAGQDEILDVIVMKENDKEAFGWNNEAYFNGWKTSRYKLSRGKYNVEINITTQNGVSFVKKLNLDVGDSIETTFLK